MSEQVSYTSFVCCHCHEMGQSRIASTFSALVRRLNCTFLAVARGRQLARVSGVSLRCTDPPNGRRTKRLAPLEPLGSGQCVRRGAAAPQVTYQR
jgi:hypothetical protein